MNVKVFSNWVDGFHFDFNPSGHDSFQKYQIVIYTDPSVWKSVEIAKPAAEKMVKQIGADLELVDFKLYEAQLHNGYVWTNIFTGNVKKIDPLPFD